MATVAQLEGLGGQLVGLVAPCRENGRTTAVVTIAVAESFPTGERNEASSKLSIRARMCITLMASHKHDPHECHLKNALATSGGSGSIVHAAGQKTGLGRQPVKLCIADASSADVLDNTQPALAVQ